mmetsp:Transcript_24988/g.43852  ORF Transcript_24988/g.43852 Transcript_24988/m.43852 type:complete len:97 (-) Transcript_24988:19-309(-)
MKESSLEFRHMILGVEVGFLDLAVIAVDFVLLTLAAFYLALAWFRPTELEAESSDPATEDLITSQSFKPIAEVKLKPLPKFSVHGKSRRHNQSKRN